jgi:acetolactate synthase-1/2/3 large subunit
MVMAHADLMIAVGARFDDRVTGKLSEFAKNCKIIHIDIDPTSIRKNVHVDVPIVGDVKRVLTQLNTELAKGTRDWRGEQAEWYGQIAEWQRGHPLRYRQEPDGAILPQFAIDEIYKATEAHDPVVSTGVGQHQMWAAQYYKFDKPRRWINSGGLGTMGFGLPAAIGVQLAFPDETVVCVTGEASIQMCIQELSTAKQYDLPIKIVNLNNRYMGMVRQWQEFFYGNRYSESYMNALPDFVKLAEAYGHVGMRIEKPGDVEGALKEAFALKDRLVFMDFITDQKENVFPMVPGGKGLTELILYEEL